MKAATATGVRIRIATPQLLAYGNGAEGRRNTVGEPYGCWISANGGKNRSWTYGLDVSHAGMIMPTGVVSRVVGNSMPRIPPTTTKSHTKASAFTTDLSFRSRQALSV